MIRERTSFLVFQVQPAVSRVILRWFGGAPASLDKLPAVRVTRRGFTYLADSPARTRVTMGDARIMLERRPPQAFDVQALDAFSGDVAPGHLLTLEAFRV